MSLSIAMWKTDIEKGGEENSWEDRKGWGGEGKGVEEGRKTRGRHKERSDHLFIH